MVIQYFVKVASFLDFARLVCGFREYPLRVYTFDYKGKKVFSSRRILTNSILHFYTDFTKDGRYIMYNPQNGKETASVEDSTKKVSNYAPIIELDSLPFIIKDPKRIKDKFKLIKVHQLGDLARITYNPDWPEQVDITLFSFPRRKKWVIGYISEIDLDDKLYAFNYVELDKEPSAPFLKYSGHVGGKTDFSNKFQHGYAYLPVIKLEKSYPIFGFV